MRISKTRRVAGKVPVAKQVILKCSPGLTLAHEGGDDAVKPGVLEALALRKLAQLKEVLGRLRHNILLQLQIRRSAAIDTRFQYTGI
jgi:hypothetical protein